MPIATGALVTRTMRICLVGVAHDAVEYDVEAVLLEWEPDEDELVFWESAYRATEPPDEAGQHLGLEMHLFSEMQVVYSMLMVRTFHLTHSPVLGHGPSVEKRRLALSADPLFASLVAWQQIVWTLAYTCLHNLRALEPAQLLAQAAEFFGVEEMARAFVVALAQCLERVPFEANLPRLTHDGLAALDDFLGIFARLLVENVMALPYLLGDTVAELRRGVLRPEEAEECTKRVARHISLWRDVANAHYIAAVLALLPWVRRVIVICGRTHVERLVGFLADLGSITVLTQTYTPSESMPRTEVGHYALELMARIVTWHETV